MMKRILIIIAIIVLSGCATSSTRSPWNHTGYREQAQSAPSRLTRAQPTAETGQEGIYTPYRPQGTATAQDFSDAYNTEFPEVPAQAYQAEQPNQHYNQQYSQYEDYQRPQPAQDDFDAMSEREQYYNGQITAPESFAATPSLPPVKVALLLPLSGEHADLGQAMLQAAQLALFDMSYKAFELMPRDTRGTPQGAAQAAQSAINSGAQLILGPLFAGSVRAAKPMARRFNINMVSFSTDWSLAGNNTYIMGFLPFAQVQRVTEYAAMNDINDIGILAPNTDYGNAVIAAYNSLAYRSGLQTAEVMRFSPEESDSSTILRQFTKYDERVQIYEETKALLEERLKINPQDHEARAELAEMETLSTWGDLPFQAVLMPVGGDQARSIANLLSFYDLGPEQVKRLGTGLWDDPGLATEPALDSAWFAAPSPDLRKGFEQRYLELYGTRPPRLASLAYDATALAAVLARKSYHKSGQTRFERSALTNPNGFAGIDGIFRFRPDGLIERGLAVLEFDNGEIKVIDPAPQTFQAIRY